MARAPMPSTIPPAIRREALQAALSTCQRNMEAVRADTAAILREIKVVEQELADEEAELQRALGELKAKKGS